ncbi:7TM diverse intracellular signaling domain-containing protein [Oligoflexus tunisiensis]|uniref:7TM diverse intracellular signaling domain-containing protein n=1 Tax=Oligoflexus tunisiensis TaxID=708132 RepID=UPI000AB616FF|nr:7TM diverse intracellular signaling domain-containing protein [Oligoflexus tunisiensis]
MFKSLALTLIGFAAGILLHGSAVIGAETRTAQKGVLNLESWAGTPAVQLNGEWEFFWNELLTPEQYLTRLGRGGEPVFATVGQRFQTTVPEHTSHDIGYATYVLRIQGLKRSRLAFTAFSAFTSSRVYVFGMDGRQSQSPLVELGRVSKSVEENVPTIKFHNTPSFEVESEQDYFILIQVANFHHSWGGLWIPPSIGLADAVFKEERQVAQFEYWLIGVILYVGIFNCSFYLWRPEDKGSLLLALFVSIVCVRIFLLSTGNSFTEYLAAQYPFFLYKVMIKERHIIMSAGPLFYLMFLQAYFPAQIPQRFVQAAKAICGTLVALVLLLPERIYTSFDSFLRYSGFFLFFACFYFLVKAVVRKEEGAFISLTGGFFLLIGTLNDAAYTMGYTFLPDNATGYGVALFMIFQSQIVAIRFARTFRRAEQLSFKLQDEVDRQTRDIKSILHHIQQGIFTVAGPEQRVGQLHSSYLAELMRQDRIEGQTLRDFLLNPSDLDEERKDMVESCLNANLQEPLWTFQLNEANFIRELHYRWPGSEENRFFEIDWNPMTDKAGCIDRFLVSVRDVTELRDLQRKNREQEEDLGILGELIQLPEEKFIRFLIRTREQLAENRALITSTSKPQPEVIKRLFVNMHTVKGAARTYSLHAISSASHEVEQFYSQVLRDPVLWDQTGLLEQLGKVEDILLKYQRVGEQRLGWQDKNRFIKVSRAALEKMVQDIHKLKSETLPFRAQETFRAVQEELLAICYAQVAAVMDEAARGLDSMARNLQKAAPRIETHTPPMVLREQAANALYNALIHLLRNSLDHGIESPSERTACHKNPEGRIVCEAAIEKGLLMISYFDDGQGLDLNALRVKAQKDHLLPDEDLNDSHKLAHLIFGAGVSTKSEVTEISGRGMGMSAVKTYIEDIGGQVSLRLLPFEPKKRAPFVVVMSLPEQHFYWIHQDRGLKAASA